MLVSIFNDVIGPVMRGPSSSHCAAALRIGRLARDLMEGQISQVLVEFDRNGSLPTTHDTQGSDMGLFGGLMGWDADDERLPDSMQAIQQAGVKIRIETIDAGDPHPNTYRLTLTNPREQHSLRAISTGGGMMEVIDVDGVPLSMHGDYFELLCWSENGSDLCQTMSRWPDMEDVALHHAVAAPGSQIPAGWAYSPTDLARKTQESAGEYAHLTATTSTPTRAVGEATGPQGRPHAIVQARMRAAPRAQVLEDFKTRGLASRVKVLSPVLPVMSRRSTAVPFSTCNQMLAVDGAKNTPLWKLAVEYECQRGGLTEQRVLEMMLDIVRILRRSIAQGIAGTSYEDRVLGHQSGGFAKLMQENRLLDGGALNRIILYVTAMMEVKSAMGVIVAMPTAGACAALPGAVIAMAEEMNLGEHDMARAFLASGLIGVFIATAWTFAAEVGGCQAEGGAAAAMAAAALMTLANGTRDQAVAAASMALQSMIGLICDPIANRVEAPCLGKNVMAAANALSCANMALAGYDPLIPLDEVIETAKRVAGQMPRELRCTALGGLSITPTSLALEKKLAVRRAGCGKGACGCG